LTMRRLDLWAT